ncbi:MAG TPA: shikimate kinase [bacterium]|nr:shikimate kinase [bacterium]HPN43293.1 shikimate kinase [bacterium]
MYPWDGKNIYFMGFMASGKSAVGREMAKMLGWPFHDTDDLVEIKAGKKISSIFEEDGEEAFRNLETQVLQDIAAKRQLVISLGGGAIIREQNRALLKQSGILICLTAPVEILAQRIAMKSHRPLMANLSGPELQAKIAAMLRDREPYYKQADYTVVNDGVLNIKQLTSSLFNKMCNDV